MKNENKEFHANASTPDAEIAISVLLCLLTSTVMQNLGWSISCDGTRLEIIQKLTAAVSCVLVCQTKSSGTLQTGLMRIKITLIAGVSALLVRTVSMLYSNSYFLILLITVSIPLLLRLCRLWKIPAMPSRICMVFFLIMGLSTYRGQTHVCFVLFRFISTAYAVLISWGVNLLLEVLAGRKNQTVGKISE